MSRIIYTTPFTYYIAWSSLDKHYYGVRYAKGCQPSDLWKSYFTSSKVVKEYRRKYGEPDIVEIRRTFENVNDAIAWEHKVLKRLNVLKSNKWLNQNIGGKAFIGKSHPQSEKTKELISISHRGEKNPMYGKKGNNNPNYGKKRSSESKIKMSQSKMGEKNSSHGKIWISNSNVNKKIDRADLDFWIKMDYTIGRKMPWLNSYWNR